ncbi:MAG: adenosylcobinamide-GDP ribazoletransferase [Candidatus Omnitrophica bacterium]|nr:adenosylcobinamide-GDP ribazoletransferase [Candidatus Omnitrophota bacterium]
MKEFLSAVQFLTIVPVKIKDMDERKLSGSMSYFPVVGLLLGLALFGINILFSNLGFRGFPVNIILVISLAILTGGIHLDGLADTADAFLSRKNKEDMLVIMRDSHIGVMGVLALISVILLKISFFSSIGAPSKITALFLMCVLSRWSMVFTIFLFPYARKEGKAKVFIQGINSKIFILATIIALICVFLLWSIDGVIVFIITAIASYLAGKFISNKIGGITGDTLGALCEINETVVLLSIVILTI